MCLSMQFWTCYKPTSTWTINYNKSIPATNWPITSLNHTAFTDTLPPMSPPMTYSFTQPTFRLEPKQRMTSAILAASAAPFQFRGCSRVPRSPKCTMVSLSSPLQWVQLRPVPWRCSDVRSVTSNERTYSLTGEQDVHTWERDAKPTTSESALHFRKYFEDDVNSRRI